MQLLDAQDLVFAPFRAFCATIAQPAIFSQDNTKHVSTIKAKSHGYFIHFFQLLFSRTRVVAAVIIFFCFLFFYFILCTFPSPGALLVRSSVPLTFGFLKIEIDKQTIFDLLSTKSSTISSMQRLCQLTQINKPLFFSSDKLFSRARTLSLTLKIIYFTFLYSTLLCSKMSTFLPFLHTFSRLNLHFSKLNFPLEYRLTNIQDVIFQPFSFSKQLQRSKSESFSRSDFGIFRTLLVRKQTPTLKFV